MMRVLDYWRLPDGERLVKLKQDEGLECETVLKNTMPTHFDRFFLSNSKRFMKNSKIEIDGFKTISVNYS